MAGKVYKTITQGASYYGRTEAVGDIATVLRTGIMPCGSGDDHVLLRREMNQLRNHEGDGDVELKAGPLGQGKNFATPAKES